MGFSCILFRVLLISCSAALFPHHVFAYPSYESCSSYICNHCLIKYPFNDCDSATVECRGNQSTVSYFSRSSEFCPGEVYRVVGEITESSYTNRTIRIACDSFSDYGSLEKYIHEDDKNVFNWKQLHSIAMGTARGIAYLHDECRNRILHCDIKPHNVLLDASFSPKVAEFGLAELTDREEIHVSLTGARGTPGYVAPQVWSRSNGPVTDRSDVYSYGMLLMGMVGGRKNFDMRASRSTNFTIQNGRSNRWKLENSES